MPKRTFPALDDEECLAREHQEVLLIVLPVVHPGRLARFEDDDADPDLREVRLDLEVGPPCKGHAVPATRAAAPARLARVQDEPALAVGRVPLLGLLNRRLASSAQDADSTLVAPELGRGPRHASPVLRTSSMIGSGIPCARAGLLATLEASWQILETGVASALAARAESSEKEARSAARAHRSSRRRHSAAESSLSERGLPLPRAHEARARKRGLAA